MKTYAVVKNADEFRTKYSKYLSVLAGREENSAQIVTTQRDKQERLTKAKVLREVAAELDTIIICNKEPNSQHSAIIL